MPELYEIEGMKIVMYDHETEKEILKRDVDNALRYKTMTTVLELRYGSIERGWFSPYGGKRYLWNSEILKLRENYKDELVPWLLYIESAAGFRSLKAHTRDGWVGASASMPSIRSGIIGRLYNNPSHYRDGTPGEGALWVMMGTSSGTMFVFSTSIQLRDEALHDMKWDVQAAKRIYDKVKLAKGFVSSPGIKEQTDGWGGVDWYHLKKNYYDSETIDCKK